MLKTFVDMFVRCVAGLLLAGALYATLAFFLGGEYWLVVRGIYEHRLAECALGVVAFSTIGGLFRAVAARLTGTS